MRISDWSSDVCSSDLIERRIDDGYAEFHWSHHPDQDCPTNEYGAWLRAQGKSYARAPLRESAYVETGMPAALHQTTWCAQKPIAFIEANAAFPPPWLFSDNIFDPHHPFDPPPEPPPPHPHTPHTTTPPH